MIAAPPPDVIDRWRIVCIRIVTTPGRFRESLVRTAWAYLRQHGAVSCKG